MSARDHQGLPATPDRDCEISSSAAFTKRPLVSVLMLAYNHGEYLAQAIESVLAQEASFPIELVIGEDCSTDSTRAIALRYQTQRPDVVRLITSDANVGAARNHRRILRAARGDFIAYLDGDDYWLPGKLARQVAYLNEHLDCSAVYTHALTINEAGERIGFFNDVGCERFDLGALLRRGNFLNNSSVLFRRQSVAACLAIEGALIDYRLHLLHARLGPVVQLDTPLTAYRVNAQGSMVASMNERVRELYWQAILSVPREQVSDDDFAHAVADFLRRVFFRAVRTRKWQLLWEWAPRVFKASPYGRIRTTLLTGASIVRVLWKESLGMFRRDDEGHRLRILYRR